jgi:hypothetical protein
MEDGSIGATQADGSSMLVVVYHGGRFGGEVNLDWSSGRNDLGRRRGSHDGLGCVHLDFGRLGWFRHLHDDDFGSLDFELRGLWKELGRRGNDFGLYRLDFFRDRLEGDVGEQNPFLDHFGVCRANDDEDKENDGINDQRHEHGRLVLAACVENAKVGKLHTLGLV